MDGNTRLNKIEKVLVVGDAHVDEHQTLNRFDWLGQLIVDELPDQVILMGDFLTLNCFSAWDLNKRQLMEGRRRSNELKAGNWALDFMLAPLTRLQEEQRRNKKKIYKPKLIYVEGNHEDRETRYLESKPELIGTVDYKKSLRLAARGFIHVPYRKYYQVYGVGFTHVPIAENNKPIYGAGIMTRALQMHAGSVVFAHTHALKLQGERLHGSSLYKQAFNCGCFYEHEEKWNEDAKKDYWKGVSLLEIYDEGEFDVSPISMEQLKRRYS